MKQYRMREHLVPFQRVFNGNGAEKEIDIERTTEAKDRYHLEHLRALPRS